MDFSKYPKFNENKIKDRRTKILSLIKRPDACHYYRILTSHQQLARQYGWECRFNNIDPLPHQIQSGIPSTIDESNAEKSLKNLLDCHLEHIEWADIIVMQRPTCNHHLELMRYIQKQIKKPVVYEADDCYIDVPKSNNGYEYFEPRCQPIMDMISEADLLTVTTEYLADIYRPLRKKKLIKVCPNSLNFEVVDGAETIMRKYEIAEKKKMFIPMRQLRLGIDEKLQGQYADKIELELDREIQTLLKSPEKRAVISKHVKDLSVETIKDYFKKSGKEVRIQLGDDEYANAINGKVVIGWSGSPTHKKDLEVISKPLMKVMKENPNCLLSMWGFINQSWLSQIDRNNLWLVGLVPVKYYYSAHKQWNVSISLCPVEKNQFNRGKCIVGDSLIITPQGIRKIETLSNFRENETVDEGCSGNIFSSGQFVPFKGFYYSKKQATIKVVTENGYQIEGTLDHKILHNKKWVKLKDFKIGDSIEIQDLNNVQLTSDYYKISFPLFNSRFYSKEMSWGDMAPVVKINEDWGRFLGYFIGNGCFTGNRCSISTHRDNSDYIEDVCNLFDRMGLKWFKSFKKDKDKRSQGSNGLDIYISSAVFVRFIKHCGIKPRKNDHHKKGDSAELIEVPDCVLKSPKSVIKEFLKGLFDSDGYVSDECASVTLTQKSDKLIRQIQFLLLLFGIKSKIVIKHGKCRGWVSRRPYSMLVLGSKSSRLFLERIGFYSTKNNSKLSLKCDKSFSNAYHDWDWDEKITSFCEGERDVFDIQVPTIKSYIANGFISHNSNLKCIESCALGEYPITSKYMTYEGCPPGIPRCSTEEEWEKAISDAINDDAMRMEVNIANRQYVEDHYDIAKNVQYWKNAYEELL